MLVHRSNERGYLVGSRGSVGSSFVATMIGITEVNPLSPHYVCSQCQYSEFITDGSYGSGFDMPNKDCPNCGHQAQQKWAGYSLSKPSLVLMGTRYPISIWTSLGKTSRVPTWMSVIFWEEYAFRAGTVGYGCGQDRLWFWQGYERDYGKYYRDAEVERLAQGAAGVKRTTGQHPGGIVVIPNYMDVYDFTPVQYPADDVTAEWQTTHFNFHDIDENVLKLDVLGHDDPTMIRKLQDLSGIDPNDIPMDDPGVMALFSGTDILGVTPEQIGTQLVCWGSQSLGPTLFGGMVDETHPTTFAELLQLSGLSHGTDVWLGNAQDLIKAGIADLSTVIGCRDDIMVYLMHAGLEPRWPLPSWSRCGKACGSRSQKKSAMATSKPWRKTMFLNGTSSPVERSSTCSPKPMRRPTLWWPFGWPTLRCIIHSIITVLLLDSGPRPLTSRLWVQALRPWKLGWRKSLKKRKNNEASNVEIDLYTTLEIVNEMWERGFKFGKLDLYRSRGDRILDRWGYPHSTICRDGWSGRERCQANRAGAWRRRIPL